MADISLNFMHPTDGRTITVTLDDTMTAQDATNELIGADFIPADSQGYNLAIKGGAMMQQNQTFTDAGAKENDAIRVIPATDAGKY